MRKTASAHGDIWFQEAVEAVEKGPTERPQKDTHRNVDAKPINAVISAELSTIFDRLGSTAESWSPRPESHPARRVAQPGTCFAVQRPGSSAGASPARQTRSLRPEAIEAT